VEWNRVLSPVPSFTSVRTPISPKVQFVVQKKFRLNFVRVTMRRALPCSSTFRVDTSGGEGKRYQFIMWLTALFCVVEVVVALLSNSLALLSDAFHNLGDVGMSIFSRLLGRVCLRVSVVFLSFCDVLFALAFYFFLPRVSVFFRVSVFLIFL
jgi:hypothetical protein